MIDFLSTNSQIPHSFLLLFLYLLFFTAAMFDNLLKTAHFDQTRNSFQLKQMVFLQVKKYQWKQIASQTNVDGKG